MMNGMIVIPSIEKTIPITIGGTVEHFVKWIHADEFIYEGLIRVLIALTVEFSRVAFPNFPLNQCKIIGIKVELE